MAASEDSRSTCLTVSTRRAAPPLDPTLPNRYTIVREERRREAEAKVEKLKMEEQRLLAVVNKWENVDRSKAADALKQLDKVWPQLKAVHASAHHGARTPCSSRRAHPSPQVWPQLEAAEALVVAKQRGPKLRLAQPPACGIRPLALQAADVAHALGSAPILRGVEMEVR